MSWVGYKVCLGGFKKERRIARGQHSKLRWYYSLPTRLPCIPVFGFPMAIQVYVRYNIASSGSCQQHNSAEFPCSPQSYLDEASGLPHECHCLVGLLPSSCDFGRIGANIICEKRTSGMIMKIIIKSCTLKCSLICSNADHSLRILRLCDVKSFLELQVNIHKRKVLIKPTLSWAVLDVSVFIL